MTYPEALHRIHFDSLDSTNDYIKQNHHHLLDKFPVMISAGTQTRGRGRSERHWSSPQGLGLYVSFGFLLENRSRLGLLPLATGIAIVEALSRFGDLQLAIKWPNDILWTNHKLAGILTETIIYGDRLTCISGIGINVNQDLGDFPPPLQDSATSLKMILGHRVSIEEVLTALTHTFLAWLEKLENEPEVSISHAINRLSQHSRGDRIRFHHGDQIIEGAFVQIGVDGGLILEYADGSRKTYYSGEIQMEKS